MQIRYTDSNQSFTFLCFCASFWTSWNNLICLLRYRFYRNIFVLYCIFYICKDVLCHVRNSSSCGWKIYLDLIRMILFFILGTALTLCFTTKIFEINEGGIWNGWRDGSLRNQSNILFHTRRIFFSVFFPKIWGKFSPRILMGKIFPHIVGRKNFYPNFFWKSRKRKLFL